MNTTKEQRKEQAIKLMEQLKIYKPYIDGFKKNDQVCFFESYGGYWVYQEPELFEKIKYLEEKHNCTVYAVTHEFLEFGECFDFLLVTDYVEEWDTLVCPGEGGSYVFSYVWNKTDDWCSEFGIVGITSFGGGIRRVF